MLTDEVKRFKNIKNSNQNKSFEGEMPQEYAKGAIFASQYICTEKLGIHDRSQISDSIWRVAQQKKNQKRKQKRLACVH